MDLNPSWEYIEEIAKKRLSSNKTDRHVGIYGDEIETLGVAGEIAARRWFGLPESIQTGFDGGADLLWKGLKVDVKATILTKNLQHRYLQWPHWKWIKADIVLLTAVDMRTKHATVVGYAYRDEVVQAPINQDRKIPCHEIPVPDLHPPWELMTIQNGKT